MAVGSNTIASSTSNQNGAPNAVDGDTSQNAAMNSCSVTLNEANPWILIDLGAEYTITHIKVFNRLDCCSKYLILIQIFILTLLISLYPW